ncbi:MAG TPA: cation diffusion facilitator family transporter [Thermoanaerobaculia bacterium]|nr:cation diffusion facilitator family transporter [Thermoanaerobaculia bacterium]
MGPESRAETRRRLGGALAVSGVLFAVEAVGGAIAHSLALWADAGHVLTDAAALSLSYIAVRIAERGASARHTFGLYRAEILAAFINAQVLLVICGAILWEAWRRLEHPADVAPLPMLVFGAVALAGNILSVRLLHSHRNESLNVKGAYLEVAADALAAAAVVLGAVAIAATHEAWIDPALSAAIAVFILPRTVSLLRQSAHILLEGAPAEVDQPGLTLGLRELPGVLSVHDLHVWTLTSGVHCASVHVAVAPGTDGSAVLRKVEERLRADHHVEHATIQIEVREPAECAPLVRH